MSQHAPRIRWSGRGFQHVFPCGAPGHPQTVSRFFFAGCQETLLGSLRLRIGIPVHGIGACSVEAPYRGQTRVKREPQSSLTKRQVCETFDASGLLPVSTAYWAHLGISGHAASIASVFSRWRSASCLAAS